MAGVAVDQTVTETASRAGVKLAPQAILSAEGGQWASGFDAGSLKVVVEYATTSDTIGFATGSGVSYNASTQAVSIDGVQVAAVDSALNGVGRVGELAMTFSFANAGAAYATNQSQADAVQTIMQSLMLTSNTHAPSALDRAITLTLTDALGHTADVNSGLRITPEADTATVGGRLYITGTEAIETLVGTTTDETIIGYNGAPTADNMVSVYDASLFGDTLTGGGGADIFKWLEQQYTMSDAADKITDFGLKGGTGTSQGAAEADILDIADLLKGYTSSSTLSDFVQAVAVDGKLQVQVDLDGKTNGSAFEKSWFMTLENVSVNGSKDILVNNATVLTDVPGLSGNLKLNHFIDQLVHDHQLTVL